MRVSEMGPGDDISTPPGADQLPAGAAPSRRGRRQLGVAAAVAVLAAGGAGGGVWLAMRPASASTTSPISVTTQDVTASTGTMKQTVSASGTLVPAEDSTLTFSVSGTVNAVDVSVGQQVVKGQPLATVDSTALSDQLAAAQATLTSEEDRLATDQAAGAAASTIDDDEAQVTSAQAQLDTAQANLAGATLVATFDGTVAAVGYTVGQPVSGGAGGGNGGAGNSASSSSASSSTSGITVISADRYTVTTAVDDTEVGEIKVGDQAVITPSGSTTAVYGTVASLSLMASSSSSGSGTGVASFPVVVDVTGSPPGLFAGAPATVSIIVRQLTDVVEVPTAAISYTNGQATVLEVVNGIHRTVPVATGVSLNGMTEVTSGVAAGDTVVERVVKFKGIAGSVRNLFGGGTSARNGRTGFAPGGFPGGGGGGGGGGFPGGGGPVGVQGGANG